MATRRQNVLRGEPRQEFIYKHICGFIEMRYHKSFKEQWPNTYYSVDTEYDISKQATLVKVRSSSGFEVGLYVAENGMFEVNDLDDWMCYHLQRVEPLLDMLVFHEWFMNACDEENKRIYRRHLAKLVTEVTFLPPQIEQGPMYRSRYTHIDKGNGVQVCPDWLVTVKFANSGKRRETIENIGKDTDAWIAMMLMVANNKDLRRGLDT